MPFSLSPSLSFEKAGVVYPVNSIAMPEALPTALAMALAFFLLLLFFAASVNFCTLQEIKIHAAGGA